MSIHREEGGPVSGTMADAMKRAQGGEGGGSQVPPSGGQGGGAAGGGSNGPRRSIFDINNRLSRPVERGTTGETVKKLKEAFEKEGKASLETTDVSSDSFKTLILDASTDQVALSAILLCFAQNVNGKTNVGVFTMVVEGSGSLRTSRFVPIGGKQVEVDIASGDVFNQTMWDRVAVKVRSAYGRDVVLHNAGAMVLPVELNPEDTAHIHRVFYNACGALFTIIDVELGNKQEPFSAKWIDRDAQKTATLDYRPLPIDNAVGLPIRDDLSITMRVTKGEQGNDLHEQSVTLTRVDGFVDLVYAKPEPMPGPYGQPIPTTQSYYPRFIITHADTEINALTPELHLLAVSTTSMLYHQDSWMSAFLPRYDSEEADLRDLGAVGYEINMTGDPNQRPEKIDTRADSFTKQSLHQLIRTAIRNRVIISLDVEERGEQSWLSSLYIKAANGDNDSTRILMDAADNLTDGNCSRIFNSRPNHGIVRDDQNRIHLGYWKNKKGELHDIRDFDYLAVLNRLGGVDPQAVVDWSATFDDVNIPLEMRLEKRMRMLRSLSGETFHLKGFARRVTFMPEFIAALNEACAAAGLVVRPTNIDIDLTGSAGRAQYDAHAAAWAGAAAGGQNMWSYDTGMFNKSYMGVQNSFFSRFGVSR